MTSQAVSPVKQPFFEVIICGAGFGGLCMAIKLLEQGRDDFLILEKGHEVGGTWRDNSYPGAACDVQSHLYSFSFEPKTDWSQRFAGWQEIQNYILNTTEKYRLRPFCRFGQEVVSAVFDEPSGSWVIETASGDVYCCRHFVLASGPLHFPQVPKIKGLDNFKGKCFHSARWDHDYDLTNKNVISIGTGGSAIQYCPEIAPKVKQLKVMQRSPAWVIPRDERAYSALHKTLFKRLPGLRLLHRYQLYWQNEARVLPLSHPAIAKNASLLAKAFIRLQVKDKQTARQLTPDYVMGCKRILISNKYFPMFNRDNVELITQGIAEVREHSLVTVDGTEHPADCIILGTGFITDPRIYMQGFKVEGLGRRLLAEDWKERMEAYYGTAVSGYPNFWQLSGPNSALGHNSVIFMTEAQVQYILQCMRQLKRNNAIYMNLKPEVQHDFNQALQAKMKSTVWSSGCRSWYQDAQGNNFALWPKSTWRFWLETQQVNSDAYQFSSALSKVAL